MILIIYISINIIQKIISHLFIFLSKWYQLFMNKNDISWISFQVEYNFLLYFILNNNSWYLYDKTKLLSIVNDFKLIIYISFEVINKIIEINYYISYYNIKDKIDFNLSKYDIFNWNNRITFSHELMYSYIF